MEQKTKKKRRVFSAEFKAKAVQLVRDSGKSIAAVARDLDLTESSLRNWVVNDQRQLLLPVDDNYSCRSPQAG